MAKGKIAIGLVQMKMPGSPGENLARALSMVGDAARQGAQIVCLPELFNARYFAQLPGAQKEAQACLEEIPGKSTRALCDAAKRLGIGVVGGSIYEKSKKKCFNTSPVIDEKGNLEGIYRKTHIPQDESYYERDYFSEGDTGFRVFTLQGIKVAPLICYDQWFPEAARSVALLGANIVFYPTAIGRVDGIGEEEGDWQFAWESVMRGHAIANAMPVAAVNRCGREGRMEFWGGSFVCDAFGKTLAKAGSGEEIVLASISLPHQEEVRSGWGFFKARRPSKYKALLRK